MLSVVLSRAPAAGGRGLPLVDATPAQVYLPVVSNFVPPNFIIIVSDDQRFDTLDFMPKTKVRIFDDGLRFTEAYVTTPLCCPSRASILTGLYAHHHLVYDNFMPLNKPTFAERLHAAGYFTGLVGKYLNSWDGTRRPEFDYWVAFAGHGAAQDYFDPNLNVNGTWIRHSGYMTSLLRDYALNFLSAAGQQPKPFLLIFTPSAPHEPADPAPGDESLYPELALYRTPSFMEDDVSDKPAWLQNQPPVNPAYIDTLRRKQLQALHALDDSVGQLLDALDATGQAERTVVIYLSDNGVFWAEHRLNGKLYAYDEATHVPFAIRYPPLIPEPRVESRPVTNVDIAPTLYELAGLPVPPEVDGRSLVPLLKQTPVAWRDAVLIEGWADTHPYLALRTERYLYIETENDVNELYDELLDPYQLENHYADPAYAAVVADLHARLAEFHAQVQLAPRWQLLPSVIEALGLED